jgi:hypothetical protein
MKMKFFMTATLAMCVSIALRGQQLTPNEAAVLEKAWASGKPCQYARFS